MYMRRLIKRTALALLLTVSLVNLTACSGKNEASEPVSHIGTAGRPVEDAMADSIMLSAVQTLGETKEQLIVQKQVAAVQGDEITGMICDALLNERSEMGDLKDIDIDNASVVLLEDGSYTVIVPVTFDEGSRHYLMNFNMTTQQIAVEFTSPSSDEADDTSIGGLLKTATVYTVIGVGTVFAVLIFISLLIYCFKFIHAWEEGMKQKSAPAPAAAPTPVPAPEAAAELLPAEEESEDDAELAAMIAAAIAAYEGTSANGLVVRSIRRVQNPRRR
jgi:sodium pump decarboxylase gamma subunit